MLIEISRFVSQEGMLDSLEVSRIYEEDILEKVLDKLRLKGVRQNIKKNYGRMMTEKNMKTK